MSSLKFGSVCSGIEAASMAWIPLGWQAQFVSEIDRFPCELLKVRHPDVPNFGDMKKFHEWPSANIDVLVGGTPCQSFSVAGLRKGLDDPRGNLMLTYLAIAARYRPEWLVWENVPGVLSSGGGRDFGSLLGGLGELGYGFAYRILDAQYFGLAQRRQRVFVVGCLGGWRRAAAVLFERASLRGDSAPSRQTGQSPAASLTSGSHPGSNAPGRRREDDVNLVPFSVAGHAGYSEGIGTLRASGGDLRGGSETLVSRALTRGGRFDYDTETFVTHSLRADGFDASEDGTGRGTPLIAHTISTQAGMATEDGTGRGAPLIAMTLAIRGRGGESTLECRQDGLANAILTPNGGRGGIGVGAVAFNARQDPDAWADRTGPLDTNGGTQAIAIQERAVCENSNAGPDGIGVRTDGLSYTLEARTVPQAVAFVPDVSATLVSRSSRGQGQTNSPGHQADQQIVAFAQNQRDEVREMAVAGALAKESGMKQQTYVNQAMSVRRLTPRECERLQGFPDDYTLIQRKGKLAADGPRYKALGNSMAVPVMAWIGKRIAQCSALSDEGSDDTEVKHGS